MNSTSTPIRQQQPRQNCCRLCLAPESECIPILKCLAADREPILNKISSCIQIKINQNDKLSLKICHHCISYLNSWQSFKTKCIASQQKQQNWLIAKHLSLQNQQQQVQKNQSLNSNFNKFVNDKSKTNNDSMSIQIKDEPLDIDAEDSDQKNNSFDNDDEMNVDVDPIQFLATAATNEEDEEKLKQLAANKNLTITKSGPSGSQPQVLSSLGLQSVNPFTFLGTILGNEENFENTTDYSDRDSTRTTSNNNLNSTSNAQPECRVCKMQFSSRANARRHERNIHYRHLLSANPDQQQSNQAPSTYQNPNFQTSRTKKVNGPITPEMMGIYDYTRPEKYRDQLTDDNLQFIAQFEDFLTQYQNLSCKCCNKEYPKYKNFMAHMRKKFPNLPRNQCFKCFKQFESKAFFVSHVKRRNCINLYKLYISDATIEKPVVLKAPIENMAEKLQAKQLLANKVYECKLCPKKFRLKLEFRSHVYDEHGEAQKQEIQPGHCSFCGLRIEDPVERKRHYNNMECIVGLRCGTCEEPFETHQKFLEHVYAEHLPGIIDKSQIKSFNSSSSLFIDSSPKKTDDFGLPPKTAPTFHSRMPQSCKICGAHYNNYNNVLRHMEAKHPDQLPKTYRCSICDEGFPRLSNLRDHMMDSHQTKLAKPKRGIYCRLCLERFEDRDNLMSHQWDQHSNYLCCICNYESKEAEEFRNHMDTHSSLTQGETLSSSQNVGDSFDNVSKNLSLITNGTDNDNDYDDYEKSNPSKRLKVEGSQNQMTSTQVFRQPAPTFKAECKVCRASFNSNQGLSNHMRAHNAQEAAKRAALGLPPLPPAASKRRPSVAPSQSILQPKNTGVVTADNRFRRMRCRICQKRFSTKKIYRRHMLEEHQITNVQFIHCAICKAEFTHEKGLKVHMIKIHGQILRDIGESNLQYECEICSIVYRTDIELETHMKTVHSIKTEPVPEPEVPERPKYWYQCKYCPSNFDSNKKLAIHVNCHEEFDSKDYSCKDCGIVYSGRKSLWVHRYKKHPAIPNPDECIRCKKIFFDKEMLVQHISTNHNGEIFEDSDDGYIDDDDDDNGEGNIPQVACTICGTKFSDQEVFTKHMQMHEQQFFQNSDNPLASMFDLMEDDQQQQPQFSDPDSFLASRINDMGEYVCDICPKTFSQLTALKVHRNWHFRADSKQIPADPNTLWRSTAKKRKNPLATLKCQYCNSTFINENNLKRHIAELHRREISGDSIPEVIKEKRLECSKCNLKFKTNFEWVDHLLQEAKETIKPTQPYEWGCVICGKVVSRKERLIQHITAHLKDNESKSTKSTILLPSVDANENKSQQSPKSSSSTHEITNTESQITQSIEKENKKSILLNKDNDPQEGISYQDESSNDSESSSTSSSSPSSSTSSFTSRSEHSKKVQSISNQVQPEEQKREHKSAHEINYDEEEDDDDDTRSDFSESLGSEDSSDDDINEEDSGPHSCDLCQAEFMTTKELHSHVSSHFVNGPPQLNQKPQLQQNQQNEHKQQQESQHQLERQQKHEEQSQEEQIIHQQQRVQQLNEARKTGNESGEENEDIECEVVTYDNGE